MNKFKLIERSLKACGSRAIFSHRAFSTSSGLKNELHADVVIAGGGMVGTSFCCALAKSRMFENRKIILLEAGNEADAKNWNEAEFENRVSSITPGSRAFFEDIGVWDKISERRYHPYQNIRIWDGVSRGAVDLNSSDVGESEMAYMIENSVIVESCMERAKELSDNVQVMFGTKVEDVLLPYTHVGSSPSHLAEVKLENGDVIKSKLLIAADGSNSFIRQKANIETADYDYKQFAVVATLHIQNETAKNNTAWQRFLPTGPIALLPLSSDCSSLVWSTTKEQAIEVVRGSEEAFVSEVNNAFSGNNSHNSVIDSANGFVNQLMSTIEPGRLAAGYLRPPPLVTGVQAGSRAMFPLALKHAPYYVKTRLALIGDAAHRIHPMAGQGVNLGFGDVKCLLNKIEASVENGEDYGNLESLLPYETERQRHNVSVISGINGLHNLFSTTSPPVVLARTFGLLATDLITPVKDRIIRYAMQ